MILVLNGGSGSGKTTLAKYLQDHNVAEKAVTDASRKPRVGERNGIDYWFRSEQEFIDGIKNNEYVEYSLYAGTYKGLRKAELERLLNQNKHIVLVMDMNGVNSIKKFFPEAISVNVRVSKDAIAKRMKQRGDDDVEIQKRLDVFDNEKEFDNAEKCDYVIDNDGTIEEAAKKIFDLLS